MVYTFKAKNGLEVTLRPARVEDAEGLIHTVRSLSPERSYLLMEYYGKDEETARKYIEGIDPDRDLLLVAIAEGKVIGALAAVQAKGGERVRAEHVVEVGLHLLKEYRGVGIGTEMLSYAMRWAKERGYRKMVASIFTPNQRSINLFKRAGFEQECIRRQHVRIGSRLIDEICMVKFL